MSSIRLRATIVSASHDVPPPLMIAVPTSGTIAQLLLYLCQRLELLARPISLQDVTAHARITVGAFSVPLWESANVLRDDDHVIVSLVHLVTGVSRKTLSSSPNDVTTNKKIQPVSDVDDSVKQITTHTGVNVAPKQLPVILSTAAATDSGDIETTKRKRKRKRKKKSKSAPPAIVATNASPSNSEPKKSIVNTVQSAMQCVKDLPDEPPRKQRKGHFRFSEQSSETQTAPIDVHVERTMSRREMQKAKKRPDCAIEPIEDDMVDNDVELRQQHRDAGEELATSYHHQHQQRFFEENREVLQSGIAKHGSMFFAPRTLERGGLNDATTIDNTLLNDSNEKQCANSVECSSINDLCIGDDIIFREIVLHNWAPTNSELRTARVAQIHSATSQVFLHRDEGNESSASVSFDSLLNLRKLSNQSNNIDALEAKKQELLATLTVK